MWEPPIIEIREPGVGVRRIHLDRAIEVGRECVGELLADEGVSRRHLRLVPSPTALSLVDLGSSNGTLVNGLRVTGRVTLERGDLVRLGQTEILVIGRATGPSGPVAASSRATVLGAQAVGADGGNGTATALADPAPALPLPPPPPAPAPAAGAPSPLTELKRRILGIVDPDVPVFPNYMELPSRVPLRVWHIVRVGSIAAYLALCVTLFVAPAAGLFVFFKVIVPLLPILFFVAPGLWRNICPLAASNQTPRVTGITRGLTPPDWLKRYGYVVAVVLFFGITSARLAVFNVSGIATGILLSLTILNAFAAGVVFKGKSGWCSSICPLLPLQRVYGQTPFVTVPNSHCQPCVGCTKNCYDFNPRVAYQADMHEPDPGWSAPRKLFVGALPGFVLGFFTLVGQTGAPTATVYEQLALFFLGSVGLFFLADAVLPVTTPLLAAVWGGVAIVVFYWFSGVTLAADVTALIGVDVSWLRWPIVLAVALLAVVWVARSRVKERQFVAANADSLPLIQLSAPAAKAVAKKVEGGSGSGDGGDGEGAEVSFGGDGPVGAQVGASLLEVAERCRKAIEAGCRMGVCGADPVAIVDGMSCLSAPEEEEETTLRRLGFAANTRMACSARLQEGHVRVSLTPEPGGGDTERPAEFDRSIVSVVVLGNGIAGVTAADFVRRGHPDCEIHLVGRESHVLYNRMGISRLVYGRSAMQGLYLLPETWYDDHGVTAWLNTVADRIDLESRRVFLGTGDVLPYDRLVLAMGSSSTVPPIGGFGRPGSFVMRTASDAIEIRAYAQQRGAREAVVSGGGLLGLEAAHSLHELGLRVTVLERGKRLLSKQVDPRCSELVHQHFAGIGMQVLYGAEADSLPGDGPVSSVLLKDGRALRCEVMLGAVGIKPNVELAKSAGLPVGRGVIVDDQMRAGAPDVFAVGDVAEHGGRVLGLWPVAAKQAEVAAGAALGGDDSLSADLPATILKGVDLDLFSVGVVEAGPADEVIVLENAALPSYRRLIVSGGRVVGAIVLGHHPDDVAAATYAVKNEVVLTDDARAEVRAGRWGVLKKRPAPAPVTAV